MDLDGDGVLSMYEMEYFYEQQMKRMERMGVETLDFEDCLCQVLDMICPQQPGSEGREGCWGWSLMVFNCRLYYVEGFEEVKNGHSLF